MEEKDVLLSDFVMDSVIDTLYEWKDDKSLSNYTQDIVDMSFKKIKVAIEFVNESRGLKGEYTTLNELYDEVYGKVKSKINSNI